MDVEKEKKAEKSALGEVVNSWRESCLQTQQPEALDPKNNAAATNYKTDSDLESDAKVFFRYLSKNTSVVTSENLTLATKSSHEESLLKLIQELGPAFTSDNHKCRVRGLHVLAGAIDGCSKATISNKTFELLGTFLLGHCGPINSDEYYGADDEDDYDSMIRDTAVTALGALTQCMGDESTGGIVEALTLRLQYSRQGIERRCAVPEEEDEEMSPYGSSHNTMQQDIRGGLSGLTRSKRSICFSLIKKTVSGVATITTTKQELDQEQPLPEDIVSNVRVDLNTYATFSSNCIHGESDPRCLMQLLTILHDLQVAFTPWFIGPTKNKTGVFFPVEDIFDAVSPYYPIQFTPPPNDIHGITREGLHQALISVLNYTKMDEYAISHNRPSMLSFSVALYLEQMMPMDGEEPPSMVERQEALDCLSSLLFPTPTTTESSDNKNLCALLDVPTTRNLAVALETTHSQASIALASHVGTQRDQCKILADSCRTLVSKIAFHLEVASNSKLFAAFVSEPLQKQSRKIRLAPSRSKTSIAYIACLAASGRSKTLRMCLSTGLEPLLDYLAEGLDDEEEVAAAGHGIAAFFSSCRVATERAKQNGVSLYPHPLDAYALKACKLLLGAFNDENLSKSTKIGIVRALECLFVSCQKIEGETSCEDIAVCDFIEELFSVTLNEPSAREFDPGDTDWQVACSTALGSIAGTALDTNTGTNSDDSTFLAQTAINNCIRIKVYPKLLESALKGDKEENLDRLDRRALATVCNVSGATASSVISLLLKNLGSALQEDLYDPSCVTIAETCSYMLRNGGDSCRRAYHDNPEIDVLLTTIGKSGAKLGKPKLRRSVENLALPETDEEKEKIQSEVHIVYNVVDCLLPAYTKFVPLDSLKKLLSTVSKILPPLSPEDNYGLCVRLPILGTILAGYSEARTALGASLQEMADQLLPGLTEFAMSSDYDPRARSAAASCLHAIITLVPAHEGCPVRPLVTSMISPTMSSSPELSTIKDCVQLLAIVGSAAACRARSSSSTAAEICRFLVESACTGKSLLPFAKVDEAQLAAWTEGAELGPTLERNAASAYGSMLSGKLKPLVRQRLNHIGLKYIHAEYESESKQAATGEDIKSPRVGLLVVACHIVCCSDLMKMDKSDLHQIVILLLEGLNSCNLLHRQAKVLVLTTTLKLISVVPSSVSSFLVTAVSGLLRAYAASDPASEVASKLIALQALERMANIEGARASAPNIKPAVVAILAAALDHPNGLLRQAAVEVQNAWYVV